MWLFWGVSPKLGNPHVRFLGTPHLLRGHLPESLLSGITSQASLCGWVLVIPDPLKTNWGAGHSCVWWVQERGDAAEIWGSLSSQRTPFFGGEHRETMSCCLSAVWGRGVPEPGGPGTFLPWTRAPWPHSLSELPNSIKLFFPGPENKGWKLGWLSDESRRDTDLMPRASCGRDGLFAGKKQNTHVRLVLGPV